MKPCPKCSQGFRYPVLISSGHKNYWKCPVCRQFFDASLRPVDEPTYKKTWQDKLEEYNERWKGIWGGV